MSLEATISTGSPHSDDLAITRPSARRTQLPCATVIGQKSHPCALPGGRKLNLHCCSCPAQVSSRSKAKFSSAPRQAWCQWQTSPRESELPTLMIDSGSPTLLIGAEHKHTARNFDMSEDAPATARSRCSPRVARYTNSATFFPLPERNLSTSRCNSVRDSIELPGHCRFPYLLHRTTPFYSFSAR